MIDGLTIDELIEVGREILTHEGDWQTTATGIVGQLVVADSADGKVAGLRMGYHESADTGMGLHGPVLGKADAQLAQVEEAVDKEIETGVGQRGVAYGRTNTLKALGMQLLHRQLLVGSVAPVGFPHLLMHALGSSLGQAIGQQLHHHLLIGIGIEVSLQTHVYRSGKDTDAVGFGTDEVGQAKTVCIGALLTKERQAAVGQHHVVALAMGIEEAEHAMGMVTAVEFAEHAIGLVAQVLPFCLRFAMHAPGKEEIVPVDVWGELTDGVVNLHDGTRFLHQ